MFGNDGDLIIDAKSKKHTENIIPTLKKDLNAVKINISMCNKLQNQD